MLAFSASGTRQRAGAGRVTAPRRARRRARTIGCGMGFYVAALLFYALDAAKPRLHRGDDRSRSRRILRFAERYGWVATLAIAVGAAVGCHVLFGLWLGAILPTGFLLGTGCPG